MTQNQKDKVIDKDIIQYVEDVQEGKILTNRYVKLSVQRFLDFLEKYDYKYKKVRNLIKFAENLTMFQGKFAGKKMRLTPWQKFFFSSVYGFYYPNTKKRVTTKVYLEIVRKQGKSTLIAIIMLYELLRGDMAGENYCLAGSRDQAKILFDLISGFVTGLDPTETYLKIRQREIRFDAKKSIIKVMPSDAKVMDGYNASMFCVDEVHAQKSDALYSVFKTSQGTRENPLAFCIGSAGNDVSGFGYEMRTACIDILEGSVEDDSQFVLIYCLESEEEAKDEKQWIKACPNLEVTVSIDFMREQYKSATTNVALKNYILSRQFGIWSNVAKEWIPDSIVSGCMRHFDPKELFHEQVVYAGVDLSSVSDFSAVAYLMVLDDVYHFYVDYFLPSDTIDNSSNATYYRNWYENKMLHLTPGNVIDFEEITTSIMLMKQGCYLRKIAYDRFISSQFVADCTQRGLKMEPFSQSLGTFSPVVKQLEILMKSGKVVIHKNPITRFCFDNVTLKEDMYSNVKPIKSGANKKIDGCIAMIMALGIYMKEHGKGTPDFKVIQPSAS